MLAAARAKSAARGLSARFEEADAEQLPFGPAGFDLVVSRHVLWTLPHPEAAVDEWIRVLRPGGRLALWDSQFDPAVLSNPAQNARASTEYAGLGDKLPFLGGRARTEIEALFRAHGLVAVGSDPVQDLVAAQAQRMADEGMEPRARRRYVVWGEVPR
jgi:ubiquinone/menaquinone biosynthesis C-methylase UbiE